MENFSREKSDIFTLDLDEQNKATFLEMTRWTKFLAIIGFVFLGLLVVAGIFIGMTINNSFNALNTQYGGALGSIGSLGFILLYSLLAAIYFYPTYALLKYSTGMKYAITHNDKTRFGIALNYLKNMFKYIGIFMIILLCIYGLAMIIGIFAVATKM